jgi:hypothetical protein
MGVLGSSWELEVAMTDSSDFFCLFGRRLREWKSWNVESSESKVGWFNLAASTTFFSKCANTSQYFEVITDGINAKGTKSSEIFFRADTQFIEPI